MDTEATYSDAAENTLHVTNSLPKGGGTYTDASGKTYSYVVFWYRLVNESDLPMEFTINIPAEPLGIFPNPEAYARIVLPPETMTAEKIDAFDYGLTDLKGFLDADFDQASRLQKTLQPKETYYFYVSLLFFQAWGTTRASLILEDQDLFFSLRMLPKEDTVRIPFGKLVFKK